MVFVGCLRILLILHKLCREGVFRLGAGDVATRALHMWCHRCSAFFLYIGIFQSMHWTEPVIFGSMQKNFSICNEILYFHVFFLSLERRSQMIKFMFLFQVDEWIDCMKLWTKWKKYNFIWMHWKEDLPYFENRMTIKIKLHICSLG